MTNREAFSLAVSDWVKPIVKSIMPQVNIPASGAISKIMGNWLGIDLSTYNLLDEFDFLVDPTIDQFVLPLVDGLIGKIPEERIPGFVNSYIDAFVKQAEEKGSINIYGIPLEKKHFSALQARFNEYLKKVKPSKK